MRRFAGRRSATIVEGCAFGLNARGANGWMKKVADQCTIGRLRCVLQLGLLAAWIAAVVVLAGMSNASSAALETVVASPEVQACCPPGHPFNIDMCVLFIELTHPSADCGPTFDTYYAAQDLQAAQSTGVILMGLPGFLGLLMLVFSLAVLLRSESPRA